MADFLQISVVFSMGYTLWVGLSELPFSFAALLVPIELSFVTFMCFLILKEETLNLVRYFPLMPYCSL